MAREASVNSDARSAMDIITERVARTQGKYHRWATTDRDERFGDLFNLVCHPVYLLVAWEHVAHNKGAQTAGIDGVTVRQISQSGQIGAFLGGIASALKDGTYRPSPVRRVLIPKPGGKSRPLGIPALRGWTAYFRHALAGRRFSFLRYYTWRRFVAWQREQHRWNWTKVKRWLRRPDGSWRTIATEDAVLFDPTRVRIERYWYRGTRIPSPYDPITTG